MGQALSSMKNQLRQIILRVANSEWRQAAAAAAVTATTIAVTAGAIYVSTKLHHDEFTVDVIGAITFVIMLTSGTVAVNYYVNVPNIHAPNQFQINHFQHQLQQAVPPGVQVQSVKVAA